jgi:hypothetical protein
MDKEVIYLDIDDEITSVIDKVVKSGAKIISLVLPKRATVFQSTVNMKLLKRKSEQVGKKIVLVSSDPNLLPLAGSIGILVARTLNSAPEIPAPFHPNLGIIETTEDDELGLKKEALSELNLKQAANVPIGQLAEPNQSVTLRTKLDNDLDTIDLDNTKKEPDITTQKEEEPKPNKKDKSKKIKVPNFKRFKLIMVLIVFIVFLVGGYILAFGILPSATIKIATNSSNVNTDVSFNLNTNLTSLDVGTSSVPAKQAQQSKTYSATVNATGQQNNGQKATGQVTISEKFCNNTSPTFTIPAGTGIVQNNLTYITQSSANGSDFTHSINQNNCYIFTDPNPTPINISAQQGGSGYNTNGNNVTFSVPGYDSTGITVSAVGGATGGTNQIVTVVSQSDITNAEAKINPNTSSVKSSLESKLTQAGFYPLPLTFVASSPSYTPNNQVGIAASSVTVSSSVSYSMYGVMKSGLIKLLDNNILSQVGNSQSILGLGLTGATFSFTNGNSDPTAITIQTTATVGPNINVADLKQKIKGLNISQVKNIITQNPNVTSISVKLSPFYVSTVPSNTSKITIIIAKPTKSLN